jgi:hypothetical protein
VGVGVGVATGVGVAVGEAIGVGVGVGVAAPTGLEAKKTTARASPASAFRPSRADERNLFFAKVEKEEVDEICIYRALRRGGFRGLERSSLQAISIISITPVWSISRSGLDACKPLGGADKRLV